VAEYILPAFFEHRGTGAALFTLHSLILPFGVGYFPLNPIFGLLLWFESSHSSAFTAFGSPFESI